MSATASRGQYKLFNIIVVTLFVCVESKYKLKMAEETNFFSWFQNLRHTNEQSRLNCD